VRGLEGQGDHLIIAAGRYPSQFVFHSEVKRRERLNIWQALDQATSEAPAGTIPVLHFRRNRGQWFACLPLADFLAVLDG